MAEMAVCSVDFFGQALGRLNNIEVIVPQAPGPFAVMYLLHGMGGDHTSWHRGMSMVRYVEELNLMTLPSHPVQLYEAGLSVLILLVLPSLFRRMRTRPDEGVMLLVCLVLYSAERFGLEFFRIGGTSHPAAYGLSTTQIVTLGGMLLFCVALVTVLVIRTRRS